MKNQRLLSLLLLSALLQMPVQARMKRRVTPAIRVACVGNSVTYGYGLPDREHTAYPVRLQAMLDSTYGADKYQVGNFGHSGSTLLYKGHRPYIKVPEFRQALDFNPNWVVIHLGLNDTDPRDWPDWKEEFIPDYRALIDSFRTVNPDVRVAICLMTPIFDRHARFQSGTRDWHAQIQDAIRSVAEGAGVQLIDLFTPLHSHPDLFPDALHPNAEGARILAHTVYSALSGDFGGLALPPLYGNGMVLQRDEACIISGRANARQSVTLELTREGQTVRQTTTFSLPDGTWRAELGRYEAGGPYTLQVTASPLPFKAYEQTYPCNYPQTLANLTRQAPQVLTIDSLWFGDVWLASGQSNMELRVEQSNTLQTDLADAARLNSRLHLFNMSARARTDNIEWDDSVLTFTNALDHMNLQGWKASSPEVVRNFSAVAFNFGRVLADSLSDVPIGIICNAVGGSTTESWIDRTTLEWQFPNILRDWRNGDFGQAWARGRMTKNITRALQKDSPVYNTLQRHPYEPCYLFEAAIQPLQHFPLKGVIWYQGESNAHNIEVHERLFTLLEESWRREFDKDLPFYVVQLSSLGRPSWPAFRDSQRRLCQSLPQTWMAVSSDVGHPSDVHPTAKRPVGERLALQALHHTYGRHLTSEGPVPVAAVSSTESGSCYVEVRFINADGLAATRGFELAGPDGLFYTATVQVVGDALRLTAPQVAAPQKVRYAWQPYTDADLHNAQGFPASTFQMEVMHK